MSSRRYLLLKLYLQNGRIFERLRSQNLSINHASVSLSTRLYCSKSDDGAEGGGGRRKSYIDSKLIQGRKDPSERNMTKKRGPDGGPALGPRASLKKLSVAEMYNVKSLREAMLVENHKPLVSKQKRSKSEPPAQIARKASKESVNNAATEERLQDIAKDMIRQIAHENAVPSMGPDIVAEVTDVGATTAIPFAQQTMLANAAQLAEQSPNKETVAESTDAGERVGVTGSPSQTLLLTLNSSRRLKTIYEPGENKSLNETAEENGTWLLNYLNSNETGSPSVVITNALDASKRIPITRDASEAEIATKRRFFEEIPISSGETMSPSKYLIESLGSGLRSPLDRTVKETLSVELPPAVPPLSSQETMSVARNVVEAITHRAGPNTSMEQRNFDEISPKDNEGVSTVLVDALTSSNRFLLERDMSANHEICTTTYPEHLDVVENEVIEQDASPPDGVVENVWKSLGESANIIGSSIGEFADHGGMISEASEKQAKELTNAVTQTKEVEGKPVEPKVEENEVNAAPPETLNEDFRELSIPEYMEEKPSLPSMKDTWKALNLKNTGKHEEFPGQEAAVSSEAIGEPVMGAVIPMEAVVTEPVIEAGAEPVVDAAAELVVEAAAVPVPEPVLETAAEPILEVAIESIAEPIQEAATEPVVEPVLGAAMEPVVESAAEPVVEAVTEPVVEAAAEPAVEAAVEPNMVVATEPVLEAAAEPVLESVVEPIVEAATEPVVEAVAEPGVEAAVEPVAEPIVEAATEPVVEAAAEPVVEAAGEPVPETAAEPVLEAAAEPFLEAAMEPVVVEAAAEPFVEATVEPVVIVAEAEPFVEATVKAATEPVVESVMEAAVEPVEEVVAKSVVEAAVELAEPAVEPVMEAATEPFMGAASEPIVEAAAEPVMEADADPVMKADTESFVEAATEPIMEAVAEPVAEAAMKPVVEAPAEPVVEAAAEPIMETTAEPVVEAAAEPAVEPAVEPAMEPASEPAVESAAEPAMEPVVEVVAKPVAEAATEPFVEAAAEPVTASAMEPVEKAAAEVVLEPVAEPVEEPVVEAATESLMEVAVPVMATTEDPVVDAAQEVEAVEEEQPLAAVVEVHCITPPDDVIIDEDTNYWILMVRKILTEFGLVEPLPPNPHGKYGGFPKTEIVVVPIQEKQKKNDLGIELPPPVSFPPPESDQQNYWAKLKK